MLYSRYGRRFALLNEEIDIHIEINTLSNHDGDSSLSPDGRKMTELRSCRRLIARGLPLLLGITSLRTLRSIFLHFKLNGPSTRTGVVTKQSPGGCLKPCQFFDHYRHDTYTEVLYARFEITIHQRY